MKELLSLCPKKLHCPVPLETLLVCLEPQSTFFMDGSKAKPKGALPLDKLQLIWIFAKTIVA